MVAAGTGERLGAGTSKGLVRLAGEPLVVHAVRALCHSETVDDVVVVAGVKDCEAVAGVLRDAGLDVGRVCTGGATRSDSVAAGLAACPRHAKVVAVHDAARPLVSPALVDRVVRALTEPWSAVAPGLPVVDTLKLVDASQERVLRTVPRRGLWAVQTPQVFARVTLQQVHTRLGPADGPAQVTDDLGLVETAGGRVRLIPGDPHNLKITYPQDLALAEAVLAARDAQPPAERPSGAVR